MINNLITSLFFGLCQGITAASLSKRVLAGGALAFFLPLVFSAVGAFGAQYAWILSAAGMFLGLVIKNKPLPSLYMSLFCTACVFIETAFCKMIISPKLYAYSRNLSADFYYSAIYSGALAVGTLIAAAVLLIVIRLVKNSERLSGVMCSAFLSLAFSSVIIMALNMCVGIGIDLHAKYFKTPEAFSLVTSGAALLFTAVMCVLSRICFGRFKSAGLLSQRREFYVILVSLVCAAALYSCENVILNNFADYDEPFYKYAASALVALMVISIFAAFLALFRYVTKDMARKNELKKTAEITALYRTEIQSMHRDMLDFKHDYMKLYSSMSSYIMNGQLDELREFFNHNISPLKEQLFDIDAGAKALTLIEDKAVQGLLYSYFIKSGKYGVSMLIDIMEQIPPVKTPIIDLNRILGIFLDNAIEEAAKSGEREVRLAVIDNRWDVLFVIKNPCGEINMESIFKRGQTTKGKGHGRGLAIAAGLCSKHDEINMHTYTADGEFICEIYAEKEDSAQGEEQ